MRGPSVGEEIGQKTGRSEKIKRYQGGLHNNEKLKKPT